MPNKPKWVEALEHAEESLKTSEHQSTPEHADAWTRNAYAWMDIAKLYRDTPPPGD